MAYPPVPYPPRIITGSLAPAVESRAPTLPGHASTEPAPLSDPHTAWPDLEGPAIDPTASHEEDTPALSRASGSQQDNPPLLCGNEHEDEAETHGEQEGAATSTTVESDAAASQEDVEVLETPQSRERPKPSRSAERHQTSSLSSSSPHSHASDARTASDPHAKARIATEIIRLEHQVAKLRRARQIHRANERGEHDSTERLEQLAEKWREAGLLAEELLRERYGLAEPTTFSTSSSRSRLSPLFPSAADDGPSGVTYVSPYTGFSPNTSAASLRFKSASKSDSDRLDEFKRSIAAAARARGVSENRILRELDDEEEEADLPDPETEFERMLPASKNIKREETPAEERFATSAFERIATPPPAYKSNSWKPPRQDPTRRPPPVDKTRKEPGSAVDVVDLAEQDESSDDELMKALDAVMEATSPLALRQNRQEKRDPGGGREGIVWEGAGRALQAQAPDRSDPSQS